MSKISVAYKEYEIHNEISLCKVETVLQRLYTVLLELNDTGELAIKSHFLAP